MFCSSLLPQRNIFLETWLLYKTFDSATLALLLASSKVDGVSSFHLILTLHPGKWGILFLHFYVFIKFCKVLTVIFSQCPPLWHCFMFPLFLLDVYIYAEKGKRLISCQYIQIWNSLYFQFFKALYKMAVQSGEEKTKSSYAYLSCASYSNNAGNKTLS